MELKRVKEQRNFKFSELNPGECFRQSDSPTVLMKVNNKKPASVDVINGIIHGMDPDEVVTKVKTEIHIIN